MLFCYFINVTLAGKEWSFNISKPTKMKKITKWLILVKKKSSLFFALKF